MLPSDPETVHTVELQPSAQNIPSKTLDFVQEQDFLEISIGLFSAKISNNVDKQNLFYHFPMEPLS